MGMGHEITVARKENNFSIISNKILEDTRMRTETRLVLGWLLGRPPGWRVQIWHVKKTLGLSDDRWRTTRKDLQKNGFYCATCRRGKDGKWIWRASVSDTRCQGLISLGADAHQHFRGAGSRPPAPYPDFPRAAKPRAVKQRAKKEEREKENKKIKKIGKSEKSESDIGFIGFSDSFLEESDSERGWS